MTAINNNLIQVEPVRLSKAVVADKTAVASGEPSGILKQSDQLSVKSNFGTVPAKENIGLEKEKSSSSSVTKVIAELVSSGLNLTVKAKPKAAVVASEKILTESSGAVAATVAAKTGNSLGKVVGNAMPAVVMAINVGITVHDAHDSYKKLTDKNVTVSSKALSAATVGLDLVTVFTHHAGHGKIAALASVVSIGTSLASDYLKHEKPAGK